MFILTQRLPLPLPLLLQQMRFFFCTHKYSRVESVLLYLYIKFHSPITLLYIFLPTTPQKDPLCFINYFCCYTQFTNITFICLCLFLLYTLQTSLYHTIDMRHAIRNQLKVSTRKINQTKHTLHSISLHVSSSPL